MLPDLFQVMKDQRRPPVGATAARETRVYINRLAAPSAGASIANVCAAIQLKAGDPMDYVLNRFTEILIAESQLRHRRWPVPKFFGLYHADACDPKLRWLCVRWVEPQPR